MTTPPLSSLSGLIELTNAGDRHPGYIVYAGLAAYQHATVLNTLSLDHREAKRLHRVCLRLGLMSPVTSTSRDRHAVRVQFIYPDRIRALLKEVTNVY
jgi:hypothetical protein